jgi:anti-anti-sigma factor
MDSSALAVVLAADRRLGATGGVLRLANVSAEVRRVLRICGLSELVLPSPGAQLRRRVCRAAHWGHSPGRR